MRKIQESTLDGLLKQFEVQSNKLNKINTELNEVGNSMSHIIEELLCEMYGLPSEETIITAGVFQFRCVDHIGNHWFINDKNGWRSISCTDAQSLRGLFTYLVQLSMNGKIEENYD